METLFDLWKQYENGLELFYFLASKKNIITPEQFIITFIGKDNYCEGTKLSIIIKPNTYQIHIENDDIRIIRRFDAERKFVFHLITTIINEKSRGKGIYKSLFLSQIELYQNLGFQYIIIDMAIHNGLWTWAKYGYRLIYPSARAYQLFNKFQFSNIDEWKEYLLNFKGKPIRELFHNLAEMKNMNENQFKNFVIDNKFYWTGIYDLRNEFDLQYTYDYCKIK